MVWIMAVLPLALLFLGVPIFIILLATSAAFLLAGFVSVPLTQIHLTMFGSVDKFALMSVPFFIFAGELMGRGGMARRLVDWVLAIIGSMRGSLPLTVVGANTAFGSISGSSAAAVAAIGQIMYPRLLESGYTDKFSSGLLASAGSIGLIIPPSIIMILYGYSAEQSVALLFIAGIIPGLVIAAMLAIYLYWHSKREGIRERHAFNWPVFLNATKAGSWALGMPVIILGGIYLGIFSPTEAGGVACVYAILVTRYVYGDVNWKGIWQVGVSSMYLTAQVLIIVGAAGVYSWLLTVSGVPQGIVHWIETLNADPWQILLVINLFLLLVGCLLDPGSAILVLTPLLLPVAKHLGVDPVHFGIVMTVNLAIGMFTPPFGINIFVAQAAFKVPAARLYPGLVPFIIINVIALMVITYNPWMSLYLLQFLN
jgi:C4-dicarboxylate transporter, DctM subunit